MGPWNASQDVAEEFIVSFQVEFGRFDIIGWSGGHYHFSFMFI